MVTFYKKHKVPILVALCSFIVVAIFFTIFFSPFPLVPLRIVRRQAPVVTLCPNCKIVIVRAGKGNSSAVAYVGIDRANLSKVLKYDYGDRTVTFVRHNDRIEVVGQKGDIGLEWESRLRRKFEGLDKAWSRHQKGDFSTQPEEWELWNEGELSIDYWPQPWPIGKTASSGGRMRFYYIVVGAS